MPNQYKAQYSAELKNEIRLFIIENRGVLKQKEMAKAKGVPLSFIRTCARTPVIKEAREMKPKSTFDPEMARKVTTMKWV